MSSTMATPKNLAAVQTSAGSPFTVEEQPFPTPGPGEVVVHIHVVAVAPVDTGVAKQGPKLFPWLQYPLVEGCDLAGTVHAVGPSPSLPEDIPSWNVGDRVAAIAGGVMKSKNSHSAYQDYAIVSAHLCFKVPDAISYEAAVCVPLALYTAGGAMYHPDHLGLPLPGAANSGDKNGTAEEWLLVWGGATTVGCCAIQLARASGYRVLTTASLDHASYLQSLGADVVLDYKSDTIVQDVASVFSGAQNRVCIGGAISCAMASGVAAAEALAAVPKEHIMHLPNHEGVRYVAAVGDPRPTAAKIPEGVEMAFVLVDMESSSSAALRKLGSQIFGYVSESLDTGDFIPAPRPIVVEEGWDHLGDAIKRFDEGVRCGKVVLRVRN